MVRPVWTRSRHEKRVREQLQRKSIEVFLPTIAKWSRWKDRQRQVEWPLFPGYCFARFDAAHRLPVLSCDGVVQIVGSEGVPSPISLMANPDDPLDQLFQLPFGGFIAARNALAKAARRPDLKQLEKPSLASWAVNQLHWHHRALLESLAAAATTLREQHRQTLAGARADVLAAEHTHREALRACLAAARGLLAAGGHPATSPTLDAIRDTLHAVPTPEVNGRLTHALTRRGLEALAGLVVAPRPTPQATQADTRGPEDGSPEAQPDERAEWAERERRARREAAESALHGARATLARAEAAVAAAAHALGERQAEHTSARDAVSAAQRLVEACAQAASHDAGRAVGSV